MLRKCINPITQIFQIWGNCNFFNFTFYVLIFVDTKYGGKYNLCMGKWDKLLSKIKSLNKEMRFDELRKVLESYGYTMFAPKSGSSHYTFRKAGCNPITIPKHEPIKVVYVRMVKNVVEAEPKNQNSEESK